MATEEEKRLRDFKEDVLSNGWDWVDDTTGWNQLHLAVFMNSLVLVQWMVSEKPSLVHGRDRWGEAPLHRARGLDVAKYLVEEAGANLFAKNHNGKTPLELSKDLDVKQYLSGAQRLRGETRASARPSMWRKPFVFNDI